MQDEAVEAGVTDEEIAAPAEYEDFELLLPGEVDRFEELSLAGDFAEKAGGTTDAEGGVRGE